MTRPARLALIAAALVVLVAGFLVVRPKSDDAPLAPSDTVPTSASGPRPATGPSPSTRPTPTVVVRGAKPVGGVKKLVFRKGATIAFAVRSDVADEVHFHGYDLHRDVPAGGTVRFRTPAKFDGIFVVELEGRGTQIASVEVTP